MTDSARRQMAASMGLDADEYMKRYSPRAPAALALGAATSPAITARPPSPTERANAAAAAKIDLLIRGMGITREQLATWKAEQLVEGKRRQRNGENLTGTQVMLLRAEAGPPPAAAARAVIPIEPDGETLALAASYRSMQARVATPAIPAKTPHLTQAEQVLLTTYRRYARPARTTKMIAAPLGGDE